MKRDRKNSKKWYGIYILCCVMICWLVAAQAVAATSAFDINKMSDMSDFNPTEPVFPTSGDTIKIGLIDAFSGPAAINGQIYWLTMNWTVHDLNKRGGIKVDGKIKKIQVIKGDTQSKPVITKKVVEKLCLQDKVDLLWGTPGSHLCAIIANVAKKYKTIYMNPLSLSNILMDGKHFNRYTFRTCLTTEMFGKAMAYYYSKRPEKKFYILCQDYAYGHDIAAGFRRGLAQYKPDAEIVGEDYHPLFLKDFAPYLTKMQAAEAQVAFTGDWLPDSANLMKQARDLGLTLPFANIYMEAPYIFEAIGGPAGVGTVNAQDHMITVKNEANQRFNTAWHSSWKNWGKPYKDNTYKWPVGNLGRAILMTYWLFDVVERAGTTNPEGIIKTWEGDEYETATGLVKMRACDHQIVRDMFVTEYVFPNKWYDNAASYGDVFVVPAKYCEHPVPDDLDRCKK